MKFILCLFRYPFIIGSCVDMQRLDNNPVINSQKTEHAGKDSLRITQKLGLIEDQYRVFGKIFQVSLQLFYIDTSFNVCEAVFLPRGLIELFKFLFHSLNKTPGVRQRSDKRV